MKTLFEQLRKQTQYTKLIHCIDSTIQISSSQKELVDYFYKPLNYLFPDTHGKPHQSVTCVVERTTSVANWPDSIEANGPVTKVDHPELGPTTIIPARPGVTLLIDRIGSIYHSGDGRFLCLVKPPNRKLQEGEPQNVSELFTALVSGSLLLADKLLIHAGCVGRNGECIIWTGKSGSGKTTRIVSLVRKGWDFYGEDQLIVGRNKDDKWIVWPYWRPIKASAKTCELFPVRQDISHLTPNKKKKYPFANIEKVLNVQRPDPGRLTSIYLLVPGNKGIFTDLDFGEAFSLIASGFMHSLLPDSITHSMDMVLDLLSSVPVKKISWDMLDQFDVLSTA